MAFTITHAPCSECGSSDALSYNDDGSSYCFSCSKHFKANNAVTPASPKMQSNENFITGEISPLTARGIHQETCKRYDYRVGSLRGLPCHVANYKDDSNTIVAQKYRFEDKRFSCAGTPSTFFGQHLFPNGGHHLCITEGEIDCLTVSQLQGNKWAVVSLPNGTASAKGMFTRHMKWLDKFGHIVLCFDNDEAGQKAITEVAHLLPLGKTRVAKLPRKDANEMLLAGEGKDVVTACFHAKPWRPDAILDGADLYERLTTSETYETIPYPFKGLNNFTKGIRKSEISCFCAGSGIGKSLVCKQILHHILKTTDKTVGMIALEESVERTANSLIGIEMEKPIHLEEDFKVTKEYKEAYENTVGSGRFFLYDHWGSLDADHLLSHVRYMIKALNVEYICLDHLSSVVSDMDGGDERKTIDRLMTKLRALVQETKVGLILVSHLKRPEGRGHEEGTTTSLSHLRGSASIAQLSDTVIGLERNQQAAENRNQTQMRVLKNRFCGLTGLASAVLYDPDTGVLTETPLQNDFEAEGGSNGSPF